MIPSLNKLEYEVYVKRINNGKIDIITSSENFENLIETIEALKEHIPEYYSDVYVVEKTNRQLSEEEVELLKNANNYNL